MLGNGVKLYPIDKEDIVSLEKDKPFTPDRDGWFVSEFYLNEVLDAKVSY